MDKTLQTPANVQVAQSFTPIKKMPFNLELLNLTPQMVQAMKPIRVGDIYDGGTNNFHEDGLYSSSIFGLTGTPARFKRRSYIDLKLGVLHPILFVHLTRIKELYGQILSGKRYAKWDKKNRDFVASNELEEGAGTGYAFFIDKLPEIKFVPSKSDQRNLRIKVVEKYRAKALVQRWPVIPAGLREIQISDDGHVQEDEIADMYRTVLNLSNTVAVIGGNDNDPVFDRTRYSLQLAVNAIHDHIESILTGKKGLIQAKWGSRRIFNGTRNVISSMDMGTDDLDSPRAIGATDTVVGLYQTAKGVLPKAVYWIRNGALSKIFTGSNNVPLVDRKTNRTVWVDVSSETIDRWTTVEGIEKLITYYGNASIRHKPIMVEGKYLALIYKDGSRFRILEPGEYENLTNEQKELCKPITYVELIYIAGYREWNKLTCILTRYPITGLGSTFPSTVYLKTTVEADILHEVDREFNYIGDDHIAYEFPRHGIPFFDTIGVNPNRIAGLGADFDGDTVSCNFLTGDESIKETHDLFNSPRGYIDPRGGLQMTGTDTIDWLLRGLTLNHGLKNVN